MFVGILYKSLGEYYRSQVRDGLRWNYGDIILFSTTGIVSRILEDKLNFFVG